MNDQELDELLDTWTVPAVPETLREKIRSLNKTEDLIPRRKHWLGSHRGSRSVAGLAAALFVFLLIGPRASPQVRRFFSAPADARFTVRLENLNYHDDGSIEVRQFLTVWQDAYGSEQILETRFPEEPFRTAVAQSIDWVRLVIEPIVRPFFDKSEELHRRHFAEFVRSGCAMQGRLVTASWRETILGYETVAYQVDERNGDRITVWRAPNLSCLALKEIYEIKRPDGTFRVTSRHEVLGVDWLAKPATH